MDLKLVENIADAVLYEGYMLYPYRASSVKNRQRFNWGALAPRSYSEAQHGTEAWQMQTECLLQGNGDTTLNVKIRFLHLTLREIGKLNDQGIDKEFQLVESLEVNGNLLQSWQEAVERDVALPPLKLAEHNSFEFPFSFPAAYEQETVRDGNDRAAAVIIRTQQAIAGVVSVRITDLEKHNSEKSLFKISVQIKNETPFETLAATNRDDALLRSLVSTHTILNVEDGEFVSLLDPPDDLKEFPASCQSTGTYPVLAGVEGELDCMLSSPIILYDYPQIAAESAGNLFDGAEIDEILTLRIMTLTDEEKREMRSVDDRARKILERTEMMPEEQLLKMHGVIRGLDKVKKAGQG